MKWASTIAEDKRLDIAIQQATDAVSAQLDGRRSDLAVAFVSEHHRDRYAELPGLIELALSPGVLIGCSAGGVIGGGHEVERRPGVSLTVAHLPGVALTSFHLETEALPGPAAPAADWERLVETDAERCPAFLLIGDPYSFDAEALLRGLDGAFPASRKIGGLASGARRPGDTALYLGATTYRSGLVGLAMHGDIEIETVVAQGCRPIGEPMFVTRADGNLLLGLDGRPPLAALTDLYQRLDPRDQELASNALFLGIAMRDSSQEYRQGDFLIRNIVGLDPDRGVMAIGAQLRENSIVQFHLRDARTSSEDLEQMLRRFSRESAGARPDGSLLFSCLGRGQYLYGAPDHDTGAFRRLLGEIPLGGFFCNGEIGPVQGTTFLHGYTSAFGLFSPRRTGVGR